MPLFETRVGGTSAILVHILLIYFPPNNKTITDSVLVIPPSFENTLNNALFYNDFVSHKAEPNVAK